MRRARLLLLILFVGVLPMAAIFGGVLWYVSPEPEVAAPDAPPPRPVTVVLAATKDLSIGSLITSNDITWAPIDAGSVLPSHMLEGKTKEAEVVGAVVRRAVSEGTPLTWLSIVRPGQYGFLAAAIRPNHRAVTIPVNRATSQAGLIYPGDRVDVILTAKVGERSRRNTNTFTGTILEDIRVVAVNRQVESGVGNQRQSDEQDSRRTRNAGNTVTLEVLPAEAERLVLATSRGDISLAMRALTDGQRRDKLTTTTFENLLSVPSEETEAKAPPPPPKPLPLAPPPAPIPPPVVAESEPEESEPSPVRVQIFRGSARQEVLLDR